MSIEELNYETNVETNVETTVESKVNTTVNTTVNTGVESKVNVNMIAAFCTNRGIGNNNTIPWRLKADLQRFKELTIGVGKMNVVIMGRKTYESLPQSVRPLSSRINVVLTSQDEGLNEENRTFAKYSNLVYVKNYHNLSNWIKLNSGYINDIFVIGGAQIYNDFLNNEECNKYFTTTTLYITKINEKFECDCKFPRLPSTYAITDSSDIMGEYNDKTDKTLEYYYMTYTLNTDKQHDELNYLNTLRDVISNAKERDDRTGNGTISHFGCHARYDLSKSFPLLTTKRVYWKGIVEELLWFLKGDTNAQNLIDKNVHIWDLNTTREFLDNAGLTHLKERDGGPIYGFNFRHFGASYVDCDTNYEGQGVDQVKEVLRMIKEDPHSRRIIINLWNPSDLKKVCLPACHTLYQFYVDGDNLSCSLYQRSGDLGLGVPFNIASASLMTHIFAHLSGKKAYELVHTIGDAHIYKNHITAIEEQLTRPPTPFPVLKITDRDQKEVEDYVYDDFVIMGYEPLPTIKMDMAV
jgi:dihydrofolate reductase/thymidylate synthase